MDDIAPSQTIPEVEVYWDCGSPTPTSWRRYQMPCSIEKKIQEETAFELSNACGVQAKKSKDNGFKVDNKCYEKARNFIDQLRKYNNNDVETKLNNSLDMMFERSGYEEDLASSPAPTVPVSGLKQSRMTASNKSIRKDLDFWDDDFFDDHLLVRESDHLMSKMTSPCPLKIPAKASSTPVAKILISRTPRSLKRKGDRSKISSLAIPGKESRDDDSSSDRSYLGVEPLGSGQNKLNIKQSNVDPPISDVMSIDACAEFFMSFNTQSQCKSRKRSLKIPSKGNAVNTLDNKTSIADGHKQSSSDKKSLRKNDVIQKGWSDGINTTVKPPTKQDISISDEILSQLVMDDSWTFDCNAKPPPLPCKTKKPPSIKESVVDSSISDNILSALILDDSWTIPCIAKQSQQNSKDNTVPCNSSKGNNITSPATGRQFSPRTLCTTSSNFQNAPTVQPTATDAKKFPQIPAKLNAFSNQNDTKAPQSEQQKSPQSRAVDVNLPKQKSEQTKYGFKSQSTNSSPASAPSSAKLSQCSAAQIEKKRREALQRKLKRQKTKV